jgi:hypothetical protein
VIARRVSSRIQVAAGAQLLQRHAVHLGTQGWRQMHPDRQHQIRTPGSRGVVLKVAAAGGQGYTTLAGQAFRLRQPRRADVLHGHPVTEFRQKHAIATLAFRQTEGVARRQTLRLFPQNIVWCIAINETLLGKARIPEAASIVDGSRGSCSTQRK